MLKFFEKDHSYFIYGKRLPSVTEILKGVGLINFDGVPSDVLQRAADFGKCVHQATALDDVGDLDEESLDPALKPYVEAWRSFRGAMKFDAIEQPLAHPGWNFAGTPDRIATIEGKMAIIEIKASSVVPAWAKIQTAAYAVLADIPAAKRIIVHLKPNGTHSIIECKDRKDREAFLCCLALFNWKINNGK